MESLKNYTLKAGETIKKGLVTTGLASALLFGTASCGETTPQDINQQKYKVEMIGYQLRSYINSRKGFVKKYNNLIAYPQTKSNSYSIEIVKADLYDKILSLNKKIESLAKEKTDAEYKLSKKLAESPNFVSNTDPLDPNKYDFLLNF